MSILDEDFWKGRIGQECRMICEMVDEAEREHMPTPWENLRQHVQSLRQAFRRADLDSYFSVDLERTIEKMTETRAVSIISLAVLRRAAALF